MAERVEHDVTELLQAWSAGDEQALAELISRVYNELHRIAARHMAQQSPTTHYKRQL